MATTDRAWEDRPEAERRVLINALEEAPLEELTPDSKRVVAALVEEGLVGVGRLGDEQYLFLTQAGAEHLGR